MAKRLTGVAKLLDRIFTVANKEFEPVSAVQTDGAVGVRIDGEWQIDVMAYRGGCIIISSLYLFVPAERTVETLEMVNRVNVAHVTGTLEFDLRDRQLRLRHDIDAPPAVINCALLRAMLRYNFHRAQDLIPKLQAFLERRVSAQQVASLSGPSSSEIIGCNPPQARIETNSPHRWLSRNNLN